MNPLFITPIQPIGSIGNLNSIGESTQVSPGGSIFRDIFRNAISDVKASDSDLMQKQYLLATGQIDDAHTVPAAAAQAQLSVDLLVSLRNKALEAYNEMIRISV